MAKGRVMEPNKFGDQKSVSADNLAIGIGTGIAIGIASGLAHDNQRKSS
jgi:hypothetical protein